MDKAIDVDEFQFDADGVANPGHRNGVFSRRREKKRRRLSVIPCTIQKTVISTATRLMKLVEFDFGVFYAGVVVDWDLKRCERSAVYGCFGYFGCFVGSGFFGSRLDDA